MAKKRLDQLLAERGLAETRTKAQALIMSGIVYVEGERRDKPGWQTDDNAEIYIKEAPRYVSRAGAKLASANQKFQLDLRGLIVLDIGSSTGGFTDYALQHGAKRVYAVDVGKNQLHEKLRADERVVVMEQTDIRDLAPVSMQTNTQPLDSARGRQVTISTAQSARNVPGRAEGDGPASKFQLPNSKSLPELTDMAVIDVSFISLQLVLPYVAQHIKPSGNVVAMCKPQFEAGVKDATKHKGVIKNDRLRRDILKKFEAWLKQNGFIVQDKADSTVKGAKGNAERFYLLKLPS